MGIHKNQRGVAHIAIILAVVILAVAGGGYYFVTKANKDKSKDTNTSQSAEDAAASEAISAACKQEVDDEDFCRYAASVSNLYANKEAYTAVSTGSMEGTTSTSTIKSDGKGNTYISTETPQGKTESITLNGTTYTKSPSQNVWYRLPKSDTPTDNGVETDAPEYNFDEPEESSGPKTIYKKLGEEACGDLTCVKYQTYSEDSPSDTWTVWFDKKDFKTRKTEIASSGSKYTTTYTYEAVDISEPSPVEDMPDYSNMSPEELQEALRQYTGQ